MANIDRIVNVQIALRTAGIVSPSFSDLLIYGDYTAADGSLVNIITDPDQLLTDFDCLSITDPVVSGRTRFLLSHSSIRRAHVWLGRLSTPSEAQSDRSSCSFGRMRIVNGGRFAIPLRTIETSGRMALQSGPRVTRKTIHYCIV